MKKYNKKIALILALSLTLALAIPALATSTNISGSYSPTGTQQINVVVSGGSTVEAILNPGGFTADIYKTSADATVDKTTVVGSLNASGDITTKPIIGVNLGGSTVAVKASVTSTLKGKFKFGSSVPSQTSTTGMIFLEALALDPKVKTEYELGYDTTGAGTYYNFDGAKVVSALNNWKHPELMKELFDTKTPAGKAEKTAFTKWFNDKKKTNQYVDRDHRDQGYRDEIVVLKKGTVESKQQVCTVPANAYYVARLSGRIGKGDKTKQGKAWTENDGFGAYIIWTFQTVD